MGLMVPMSGSFGINPIGIAMIVVGFILFGGGSFGMMFLRMSLASRALSAVRRKISELNARFAHRGVDFQLHESRHLEYYRSSINDDSFRRGGYRTVVDYTLVVQALDANGRFTIPAPDEARRTFEQAMNGVSV